MPLQDNPAVIKLLKFKSPFVAFWFPWYWRSSRIAALRKVAGRGIWLSARGTREKVVLVLKAVIWPPMAFICLLLSLHIKGEDIRRVTGKSKGRQIRELIHITVWRGFRPMDYYDQRLYLFHIPEVIGDFLSALETSLLNIFINSEEVAETVNDKSRFERKCREFNLPAIPTVAAFKDGYMEEGGERLSLPLANLYFKPVDGLGGKGIERWDHCPESIRWKFGDTVFDEQALLGYFREKSKTETFVLQEEMVNHPSVARFSLRSLVTFRVMTVHGEGYEPEIMAAYMVMPRGHAVANHGSYGGIVSQMNLETKQFERCFGRIPILERLPNHPETGAPIEGHELKEWPLLEALALKAHSYVPDILSIGWDLALTTKGPVIVEGNTQWGSMSGFFLGRTSYPKRYLEILHREKERGNPRGQLL